MGPHPCEQHCKTILKDSSFDAASFIRSNFSDFWLQIADYLDCFSKKKHETGFFKRPKYPNIKGIIEALNRLIPSTKEANYPNDITPTIDNIFCQFFHPDTPQVYRQPATAIFFQILKIVNTAQLNDFKHAISLICPYIRFTKEESERQQYIRTILDGISPIVDPNYNIGGINEGIRDLRNLLKFVQECWITKIDFCIEILYDHVLLVIYKKEAAEAGFTVHQYGFDGNTPESLHYAYMDFTHYILSKNFCLDPFFTSNTRAKLMVLLLAVIPKYQHIDGYLSAIQMSIKIMNNETLFIPVMEISPSAVFDITSSVCLIIANGTANGASMPEFINQYSKEYFFSFFKAVFKNMEIGAVLSLLSKFFDSHTKDQFVTAYMLLSLFNYLISNNDWRPEIWKEITQIMMKNRVLIAAASKYAQYLALCVFPIVYKLNKEQLKTSCNQHTQRKSRTKQNSKCDFLAENVDKIIDAPHEFVMTDIKLFFMPHQEYESIVSLIQIPPLKLDENNALDIAYNYMDQFNFYSELKNTEEQCFAFSPILSFICQLNQLRFFPTEVNVDGSGPYKIVSRCLFKAILSQNNMNLRQIAFEELAPLVNCGDVMNHMKSSDLSNWYSSLLLMLLSSNSDLRDKGFKEATITIQHALIGSGILIPVMVSLCEQDRITIDEVFISFFSSLPLFSCDLSIPEQYKDYIETYIKNNSYIFLSNASQFLNTTIANMPTRIVEIIGGLHEKVKSKSVKIGWSSILPLYLILISHELTLEPIKNDTIVLFLNRIFDSIADRPPELIQILYSCLVYFNKISTLIPEQFTEIINKFLEYACSIRPTDNTSWDFDVIKLASEICITCYPLAEKTESYPKFIKFLYDSVNHQSFIPDIKNLMSSMIDLLSVYFGNYPFPNGPSFATNLESFPTGNEEIKGMKPCFTKNGTIINVEIKENKAVIHTQISTGHYVWEMENIENDIIENQKEETLEFSFMDQDQECEISPSYELACQKDFAKIFDDIISQYESDFVSAKNDSKEDDVLEKVIGSIGSNIKKASDNFDQKQQIESYTNIPPIGTTNIIASSLIACGCYHPENNVYTRIKIDTNENANPARILINNARQSSHRAGIKLGVLYVGREAHNQYQILSTSLEETSSHFKEFITGLGWTVDLESHYGYDGGLDRKAQRDGETSIYYSDFVNEVMFHVAPLMPTDLKDDQQIGKKRHIGNDHVHIVWCEHDTDYDVTTITSQFNKAHIVIYPLSTALFRVEVSQKSDLGWFGPLRKSVIVSKTNLPSLVRSTAISAMVTYNKQRCNIAYTQNNIKGNIRELIENHADISSISKMNVENLMVIS